MTRSAGRNDRHLVYRWLCRACDRECRFARHKKVRTALCSFLIGILPHGIAVSFRSFMDMSLEQAANYGLMLGSCSTAFAVSVM